MPLPDLWGPKILWVLPRNLKASAISTHSTPTKSIPTPALCPQVSSKGVPTTAPRSQNFCDVDPRPPHKCKQLQGPHQWATRAGLWYIMRKPTWEELTRAILVTVPEPVLFLLPYVFKRIFYCSVILIDLLVLSTFLVLTFLFPLNGFWKDRNFILYSKAPVSHLITLCSTS